MYELDRRLVVARLRRGRRLKAERGGFAGGGVRYGFTTERKQLVPDQAEREVVRHIRGCTGVACRSARSPISSTPSRSQPNAAASGTRPPSPGSFGGQHEHLRGPIPQPTTEPGQPTVSLGTSHSLLVAEEDAKI
jgi:hypothetical protein